MTTVNYLSRARMKAETGMDALGYSDPKNNRILLRKGLPKRVEKEVRAHEFEHMSKGEEGPFVEEIFASGGNPWVAGGMILGGSLISGLLGNKAAEKQAEASLAGTQMTVDEQRRQFDLNREDTAPYRAAGSNSLALLMQRLRGGDQVLEGEVLPRFEFDASQLQDSPGYQFMFDEAMRGVNRQAAAGGKRNSGNVLAALQDRAAGIASTEYGNEFNRQLSKYGTDYARAGDEYGRRQNYMNWLSTVAGVGQNAVGQSGAAGQNMANVISQANMANAANQANAANTKYGAWNNAIQGGIGNYLAYNQNQQLMKYLNG